MKTIMSFYYMQVQAYKRALSDYMNDTEGALPIRDKDGKLKDRHEKIEDIAKKHGYFVEHFWKDCGEKKVDLYQTGTRILIASTDRDFFDEIGTIENVIMEDGEIWYIRETYSSNYDIIQNCANNWANK